MSSVSIYFVQAALEALRNKPEVIQSLLLKNHISPKLLNFPDARIPDVNFANLLRDLMFETKDEMLGLGIEPQPLGSWATMSQLCIGAGTLGEALKRMARFYRFMSWGVTTQCCTDEKQTSFIMNPNNSTQFSVYVFESFLFYVYRFSNWLIDRQISLISVDFSFPPSAHRNEYQRLFFTNQITFNKNHSSLNFSNKYLNEPIRQDEQSLKKFLAHSNLTLITQSFPQSNWQTKVQKILAKYIQYNPCIKDVSDILGIHPHTLRSYLRKEGIQFKDIKEYLRLEIAIHMLLYQKISIESIAEKLGYSETGAFTRAFKKWTGSPPLNYRNIHK